LFYNLIIVSLIHIYKMARLHNSYNALAAFVVAGFTGFTVFTDHQVGGKKVMMNRRPSQNGQNPVNNGGGNNGGGNNVGNQLPFANRGMFFGAEDPDLFTEESDEGNEFIQILQRSDAKRLGKKLREDHGLEEEEVEEIQRDLDSENLEINKEIKKLEPMLNGEVKQSILNGKIVLDTQMYNRLTLSEKQTYDQLKVKLLFLKHGQDYAPKKVESVKNEDGSFSPTKVVYPKDGDGNEIRDDRLVEGLYAIGSAEAIKDFWKTQIDFNNRGGLIIVKWEGDELYSFILLCPQGIPQIEQGEPFKDVNRAWGKYSKSFNIKRYGFETQCSSLFILMFR
jgi:hypothetical protein